jgi:creatine kinase
MFIAGEIIFKDEARKKFLREDGRVDWNKVTDRYEYLRTVKESLGNKHFTPQVLEWILSLPEEDQQRLLDIKLGGLSNEDASVGVYATRPEDYEVYAPFFESLIRAYHKIEEGTVQKHDWNIPVNEYVLTKIDPKLEDVSMRARVARNVIDWNLPSSMSREERIRFEGFMEGVFATLPFAGKYHSLTSGHEKELSAEEAAEMQKAHYLFNNMTSDNHLTASGIASDWPHGRGMWLSEDKTKMIWVNEEDHLRIISIVHGNDLGAVDKSLSDLLVAMEMAGVEFAEHPVYGVITTCPTNMGTGKRQSILGKFPFIIRNGVRTKRA